MIKISFIIPTYNREKELRVSIQSILNQTLKEIEIIVVDDGSTDNTEKVIKGFKDKRIKYFKRTNHGIGNSRNYGIEKSNGEYIAFIDSDDYIEKTFAEEMYNKATNDELDLVICDYYNFYKNGTKQITKISSFENTYLKNNKDLLLTINYGPCNKLYKREILKKNKIKFPENIKYEDMPFVAEVLKVSKLGKLDLPLNYFFVDNVSETMTRDELVFDIFKVLDIIVNIYNEKEYKPYISSLIIKTLTNYTIQQRYQNNISIRNKFIEEAFIYMKKYDNNFKNNNYFKTRNILKRTIEKNKVLTKNYCNIYNLYKKR